MTETVELKPCPFCGGALSIIRDRDGDPLYAHPDSETCVLSGMSWDEDCFDVAAWNTRSDPAVRDRVKQLEWEETFQDRGDGSSELSGWEAETPGFSVFYTIEIEVFGFLLRRQDLDITELGAFSDPDEAKAVAQADYEQRILSALEPLTAPVRDRVAPKTGIDVTGFYRKCSPDTPGAEWGEGIGYYVHDEQARIEGKAAASALRTSTPEPASGWMSMDSAPKDKLVMLAAEFPITGSGDWRMKVGGWREDRGHWEIFGASWKPTRWQPLLSPPAKEPQ